MIQCVDNTKYKIFSDIPGYTTSAGGSIPPNILVTSQKPDIVLISKIAHNKIDIFELTVPFEPNIKKRHEEKSEKYSALERDLTDVGYQADVTAFEIGCRGLIDIDNTASLKKFKKFCKKEINFKKFKENISALSTVSSYYIFTSRKEPSWSDTPFLTPIHQSQ